MIAAREGHGVRRQPSNAAARGRHRRVHVGGVAAREHTDDVAVCAGLRDSNVRPVVDGRYAPPIRLPISIAVADRRHRGGLLAHRRFEYVEARIAARIRES